MLEKKPGQLPPICRMSYWCWEPYHLAEQSWREKHGSMAGKEFDFELCRCWSRCCWWKDWVPRKVFNNISCKTEDQMHLQQEVVLNPGHVGRLQPSWRSKMVLYGQVLFSLWSEEWIISFKFNKKQNFKYQPNVITSITWIMVNNIIQIWCVRFLRFLCTKYQRSNFKE